ncbi:glycosyltransferase, partial [mine drainage metagenome]
SPEFRGLRINGGIPYEGGGDDSELTSIVIRKGYLAIKDFDVMVMVSPKRTVKTFSKQLVRWTRNSWRSFFLNFRNGTAKKAGNFYRAEMIMTFAMPILFTIAIFIRAFFYVHTIFHHVTFGAIPSFTSLEFVLFSDLRRPIALLSSISGERWFFYLSFCCDE